MQFTNKLSMKTLFSIICVLITHLSLARNYYVSATGDDGNAGSKQAPWKSIDKVNAFRFNAGDSILFNRGDSFYGALNCQSGTGSRPIVYSDYGTGKLAVITGFKTIKDWKNIGNRIFESNQISDLETVTMVVIDGKRYAMGRYPNNDEENGGFITISAHQGNESINSSTSINGNFSGGVVVIRKKRWVFDRNNIVSN